MSVTELIAALSDKDPNSTVAVNVGGTQVEDFTVEVDTEGHVVLTGGEGTEV